MKPKHPLLLLPIIPLHLLSRLKRGPCTIKSTKPNSCHSLFFFFPYMPSLAPISQFHQNPKRLSNKAIDFMKDCTDVKDDENREDNERQLMTRMEKTILRMKKMMIVI